MPLRRRRTFFLGILCLIFVSVFYLGLSRNPGRFVTATPRTFTQTIVVASTSSEDTSWIARELPNMNHAIYKADDGNAPFHPPMNKGHESLMYLTYIVDHYYNLSDTTIFTHAQRDAWHNNDLFDFDLARMVQHVSNEHVQRVGYFNLRCHHESGCPDHIKPRETGRSDKTEQPYFSQVWEELHGPNAPPIPETLAVACCSQFAVSREAIHRISLKRWEHYRDWLLHTRLSDSIAGRIWEFTWHYILTKEDVVCPPIEYCYCDGFGLCFHGEGEIMSWMTMKEVNALASQMKKDFSSRGMKSEGADVQHHLDQRIGRPMNKWIYEAELRGKDPYMKALLSGRVGTYYDGYGL